MVKSKVIDKKKYWDVECVRCGESFKKHYSHMNACPASKEKNFTIFSNVKKTDTFKPVSSSVRGKLFY